MAWGKGLKGFRVEALGILCVRFRELNLSCHHKERTLFTADPYCGNLN